MYNNEWMNIEKKHRAWWQHKKEQKNILNEEMRGWMDGWIDG